MLVEEAHCTQCAGRVCVLMAKLQELISVQCPTPLLGFDTFDNSYACSGAREGRHKSTKVIVNTQITKEVSIGVDL